MICVICGKKLTGRQTKFCSAECKHKNNLNMQRVYRESKRNKSYKSKEKKEKNLCFGCHNFFECRDLNNRLKVPYCVVEYKIKYYDGYDIKKKTLVVLKCKNHKGGM
jgi:hypothetical protein